MVGCGTAMSSVGKRLSKRYPPKEIVDEQRRALALLKEQIRQTEQRSHILKTVFEYLNRGVGLEDISAVRDLDAAGLLKELREEAMESLLPQLREERERLHGHELVAQDECRLNKLQQDCDFLSQKVEDFGHAWGPALGQHASARRRRGPWVRGACGPVDSRTRESVGPRARGREPVGPQDRGLASPRAREPRPGGTGPMGTSLWARRPTGPCAHGPGLMRQGARGPMGWNADCSRPTWGGGAEPEAVVDQILQLSEFRAKFGRARTRPSRSPATGAPKVLESRPPEHRLSNLRAHAKQSFDNRCDTCDVPRSSVQVIWSYLLCDCPRKAPCMSEA